MAAPQKPKKNSNAVKRPKFKGSNSPWLNWGNIQEKATGISGDVNTSRALRKELIRLAGRSLVL